MDVGSLPTYCRTCNKHFSSAYNRNRHILRKHYLEKPMETEEDHDIQSASENDSDAETVDYAESKPDEAEKILFPLSSVSSSEELSDELDS